MPEVFPHYRSPVEMTLDEMRDWKRENPKDKGAAEVAPRVVSVFGGTALSLASVAYHLASLVMLLPVLAVRGTFGQIRMENGEKLSSTFAEGTKVEDFAAHAYKVCVFALDVLLFPVVGTMNPEWLYQIHVTLLIMEPEEEEGIYTPPMHPNLEEHIRNYRNHPDLSPVELEILPSMIGALEAVQSMARVEIVAEPEQELAYDSASISPNLRLHIERFEELPFSDEERQILDQVRMLFFASQAADSRQVAQLASLELEIEPEVDPAGAPPPPPPRRLAAGAPPPVPPRRPAAGAPPPPPPPFPNALGQAGGPPPVPPRRRVEAESAAEAQSAQHDEEANSQAQLTKPALERNRKQILGGVLQAVMENAMLKNHVRQSQGSAADLPIRASEYDSEWDV